MLEVVFDNTESTDEAITTGITIQGIVNQGSPWIDEGRRKTVKVNFTHIPLKLHKELGDCLKDAMAPYGQVLQVRKYTNSFVRFMARLLSS